MGDRANILVKEDSNDNGVYLYTHWGGSELPVTLQNALKKKWRWNDAAYLTRIIFDEMTKDEHGQETGYGISSICGDGDDRILEVNCEKQTISYNKTIWTFQQFIDLSVLKIW